MITEDPLTRTIHQVFDGEEPSPGFEDRIVDALPRARARRFGSSARIVPFAAAAAAIVLVAVLVAVPLSFQGTGPTPSGAPPSTLASASASVTSSTTASATPSATPTPIPPLTSVTWTQVASTPFGDLDLARGTAWSGGFILSGFGSIWRSADGSTWEPVLDTAGVFKGGQIYDIEARGSTIVAVGRIPQTASTPATGLIWISHDAITWQRVADPGQIISQAGQLNSVAAGKTGFVACGSESILYSSDGEHWERDASPDGLVNGDSIASVTATSEGFAAVGQHAPPPLPSGAVFLGGSHAPAAAWWSADGRTWHAGDVGSGGYALYGAQQWVGGLRAFGSHGGGIGPDVEWRSTDAGKTWHRLPSPPDRLVVTTYGALLAGGRGVEMVRDNSSGELQMRWTADGDTWQPLPVLGGALPLQSYLLAATDRLLIASGVTGQGNRAHLVLFLGVLK